MKAQVNGIDVEGTPAEVAEFIMQMKTVLVMDGVNIDRVADAIMEAMKMPQKIVVEEESAMKEIIEKAGLTPPIDHLKEKAMEKKMEGVKWEPAPMTQLHGPLTLPGGWKVVDTPDGKGIKLENSDHVEYSPIDFSTADHTAHLTLKTGFSTDDSTAPATIKALDPLSPKVQERQQLKNFLLDVDWRPFPFMIVANEEIRDVTFGVPDRYMDYVDRTFVVNKLDEAARLLSGYVTAKYRNQIECDAKEPVNEVDSDDDES